MACSTEVQADLATSFGVQPVQVTVPTWVDHVYSCKYVYSNGVMSLSVKELNSAPATTRYFDALANRLGRRPLRIRRGQGGFYTTDGSVVVRKDFKVLDIDVSQMPPAFADGRLTLPDVAIRVAAAILRCWAGS